MIFHRNSGIDWFCPLSVDWVESDTVRWASEMIRQIQQQKAGKVVSGETVDFRIIKHGE